MHPFLFPETVSPLKRWAETVPLLLIFQLELA